MSNRSGQGAMEHNKRYHLQDVSGNPFAHMHGKAY